ncbi:Phospholipase/carboxylesterase [Fomitiporia mediterranea MF3/22]|uniref:Phospholipase/carboxylesterase n=1 Tax=Fomitiporia mediterranea (strain MF3/22) TaxID=694068 RepID=UPI00044076DA|nr:Phospholipase/carboxylesterase [Fomitiporia mediterranea MF3/22]EJD01534.1 Phospholipase/carboxylesterase [Fomitiporia mediterranea MF3/22]
MAAIQKLEHLVVKAASKHTATVIFVHGLGDTGEGWEPVAKMLSKDEGLKHVKWVLPHAPIKPVTANMGMSMPSWFDIYDFGFNAREDEKGMLETTVSLNALITDEVDNGIPASRVVLGGFSQGGAMSLLTGLTSERKLTGIAVLSGWLPLRSKFVSMMSDHAKKLPIFWGHGTNDPLVRPEIANASRQFLEDQMGIKGASKEDPTGLEFHPYPGLEHSAAPEEIGDLGSWLKRVVPQTE